MFGKRDNGFDEVEEYRRKREQTSVDEKFNRDDYQQQTGRVEVENNESVDNSLRDNSRQQTIIKNVLLVIIVAVICYVIFLGIKLFMDSDTKTDKQTELVDKTKTNEKTNSPYDTYFLKTKVLTIQEFVKEYELAKKNRLKFDRLSMQYQKGNYQTSFVVNERYLESESVKQGLEYNYFSCVVSTEESADKILRCGNEQDDQKTTHMYPKEFIYKNERKLRDYGVEESDSMDQYYINGSFYTLEYCEAVKAMISKG